MEVAGIDISSADHVARLRRIVNRTLPTLVEAAAPAALYDPVRYVLEGEGKRLRPVLLLLAAEAFGTSAEEALPAALATEVFHNFTLVHDDIMDHADTRRGRPTVHRQWDESTAILCGDYLLALSYDLLARLPAERIGPVLRVFHQMVARLCEGQTLDKVFETRASVSVEEYLHMIDCKTGALLQSTLEIGGLIGGASPVHLQALREAGHRLGRAFQIQDDLLDLVAEDARWGKVIGGDLREGKKAYLLLRALERSEGEAHAWFARILTRGGLPEAEVPEARNRMERLGVLEDATQAVAADAAAARTALQRLPDVAAVHTLQWLMLRMQARLH